MLPVISLFGIDISLYGVVFLIGFFVAIIMGCHLCKRWQLPKDDVINCSVYAGIGILVGSKILYFLTRIPHFIDAFSIVKEEFTSNKIETLMVCASYLFGGNVFYGGLIGGLLFAMLYCKIYKVSMIKISDLFSVFIPFIHSFGRIGCFLAGCCYGIEYNGFGSIQFPYNKFNPVLSEGRRFPTQLVEASMNFILFYILYSIYKRKERTEGKLIGLYLCCYSIFRFFMEFFRGDTIRGHLGMLSTSQIVSTILLPIGIYLMKASLEINRR